MRVGFFEPQFLMLLLRKYLSFCAHKIGNFLNFWKMTLLFTLAKPSGPQWPFSTNHSLFLLWRNVGNETSETNDNRRKFEELKKKIKQEKETLHFLVVDEGRKLKMHMKSNVIFTAKISLVLQSKDTFWLLQGAQ